MDTLVPQQNLGAFKAFLAVRASKSSLLRVNELVFLETGHLSKSLPTQGADERPFPGVNPLVPQQVGRASELFPAHGASEWSLPSVGEDVCLQVGRLSEALPTSRTHERPFLGVRSLMGFQLGRITEPLPTVPTFTQFLHHPMPFCLSRFEHEWKLPPNTESVHSSSSL